MIEDLRNTTVSKNYVHQILQTLQNALVILDQSGHIREVNHSTLSLLGYKKEDLISQPFSKILQKSESSARLFKKDEKTGIEVLSDRELEVFQCIGSGLSSRQIAEKLYISIHTVDSYKKRIKEKLNLPSNLDLSQFAIQWNKDSESSS